MIASERRRLLHWMLRLVPSRVAPGRLLTGSGRCLAPALRDTLHLIVSSILFLSPGNPARCCSRTCTAVRHSPCRAAATAAMCCTAGERGVATRSAIRFSSQHIERPTLCDKFWLFGRFSSHTCMLSRPFAVHRCITWRGSCSGATRRGRRRPRVPALRQTPVDASSAESPAQFM